MQRSLQRVLALGAVTLACVFAARPASAQYYGSHFELTPFAGYYIAQDLYTVSGSATGNGSTIGLNNSFEYGGRLGFYPKPYGGLEFSYTRSGSDVEIKQAINNPDHPTDFGRINYDRFDINFVGRQSSVTNDKVQGFGTIGFGWTTTRPDLQLRPGTSFDSNTLFGWNFGLGCNINTSEKVAVRLEGRWQLTDTNITTGNYVYCDYWGYCYGYSSDTYSSGDLTMGLTYKFGQK